MAYLKAYNNKGGATIRLLKSNFNNDRVIPRN